MPSDWSEQELTSRQRKAQITSTTGSQTYASRQSIVGNAGVLLFYLASPAHVLAVAGKLTNTADLIRLIIRDEAVHGYHIG